MAFRRTSKTVCFLAASKISEELLPRSAMAVTTTSYREVDLSFVAISGGS